MVRHQCYLNLSSHILLDAVHHCLHVAAYRIEVHRLMHLLSIPACDLILPVKLTLCQCVLLEKVVCLHKDKRCRRLESYTALDADNGVADVDVAADSEWSRCVAYGLDNLYRAHLNSVE